VPPVPRQHPLVQQVAGALPGPAPIAPGQANALPAAPALPELVTFDGFVSGNVQSPSGTNWLLVYREWRMITWLLVEGSGVIHLDRLQDGDSPGGDRDVLWVTRTAAVGRGSGSQSDEARFLTGQFIRAGDFDPTETGGASAAETGLFCPRTPLCNCGPRSRY
jgi:hypothetical protein